MDSSIIKRSSEFLKEKNKHMRWRAAVTALALVVIVATAYILSKPAQTLAKNTFCGMEEHEHTEECYRLVYVCGEGEILSAGQDALAESGELSAAEGNASAESGNASAAEGNASAESGNASAAEEGVSAESGKASAPAPEAQSAEIHHHDETCYAEEKQLVCGREEGEGHVHTDECKAAAGSRELTCGLEEGEGHSHTDECVKIVEEKELTCGLEESEGHAHTDACKTLVEEKELTCGREEGEEHTHTDSCYTVSQREEVTCGQEESEGHAHGNNCYTVNRREEIVCGQEESEGHTHDESCYTVSEFACGLEESEAHSHTDDCYEIVRILICGKKESAAAESAPAANGGEAAADGGETPAEETEHVHTEECCEKILICNAEEHEHEDLCYEEVFCGITGHVHGAGCYDEEGNLTCEIMEHRHEANCYKEPHCGVSVHIHQEDCYDGEGNLICGLEEHIHTDECYVDNTFFCTGWIHTHSNDCYDLEGKLSCGYADYQYHVHDEACYDKNERLICPLAETEFSEEDLHTHTEECYGVRGVLICGRTEVLCHVHSEACHVEPEEDWKDTVSAIAYCGLRAHAHRAYCKDEEGNFVCGQEEHIHTEECYEETGYGCIAGIHIHEAGCYGEDGNIRCGLADYCLHTHSRICYGIDGKLLCTLPERAPHTHGDACYVQESPDSEPVLSCILTEAEAHRHEDACRGENGNLICGKLQVEEHEHTEACIIDAAEIQIIQTCRGDGFIVTAVYNKKETNLPEDAQLFAELIPEEGNEEYYAQRRTQYQEMQGEDEKNAMQALMRIGFTADGVEVEPEGPVTIKVQLLDENGMEEGSPVTVVHFGDEGTERLDGSNAEQNSTTFRMNSFSEIALGWKKPVKTIEVDEEFSYTDEAFTVTFHVEGEAILPEGMEVALPAEAGTGSAEGTQTGEASSAGEAVERAEQSGEAIEAVVEALGEETEAYQAALTYTDDADITGDLLSMQVLSYGLYYQGAKLDLTDCKVSVEVRPTQELIEYAENMEASIMAIAEETEDGPSADEIDSEVSLVALNLESDGEGFEVGDVNGSLVVGGDAEEQAMRYDIAPHGEDNTAVVYAASAANPRFTVEFYANIEEFADDDYIKANHLTAGKITVIDTSGKKLPTNGGSMAKKSIYITTEGTVVMMPAMKEIYSSSSYEYVLAPGLVYFDKIAKNKNYILKEIQVQRESSSEWEHYSCEDEKEWHFTNKQATWEANKDDFILITNGATIRLVHDRASQNVSGKVEFYDYDVSDGNIYDVNGKPIQRDDDEKTHESGETWYLYTAKQGINSMKGQTFGFGNSEGTLKSGLGDTEGNKANAKNSAYGSPTFGLVTGLKDGKVQYKSGVVAPNLFNEGAANGKEIYEGNLIFRQEGDTYTLTGAEVEEEKVVTSGVYGIDQFTRQQNNWNKTYYFAANDFYPVDTVSKAGTDLHDPLFGSAESTKKIMNSLVKGKPSKDDDCKSMALSDDGLNHNHYFGMYYTVEFDLVEDYIGPLEYLFYGDDDMWVFLSEGESGDGQLICDIGGVHSAVGEYVDLWDYIQKGTSGHYKLTFFYTERGASGSTCWMQFTLPSVSFATTEQDTGKLVIKKQITGSQNTDEEFGFNINFYEPTSGSSRDEIVEWQENESNVLKNDYSYTKYDANGTPIARDILIWNDCKFTLRAGEYIEISFLPVGSSFAIEEIGPVTVDSNKGQGEELTWTEAPYNPYTPEITGGINTGTTGKVIGVIGKDSTVEIEYNNVYEFTLPETGGSGTTVLYTLAGALSVLAGAGLMYRKKFRERGA
ncbi:MAG: fibro-slime domain-containing protein [Roseburia sp.]|nr:fibro-slime domain-containing protein [Roseburia sp.]MCM1097469.1 fibro-slime domain-containing protein [Ruminococcus flavefaciens]